jgi:hypothetical protein
LNAFEQRMDLLHGSSSSSSANLVSRGCDNPPRKIPYYCLNQSTLVTRQY